MKKRKLSSSLPYGPTVHLSLLPTLPLATTQLPSATELWHTPTRTSSVLMWRLTGARIPRSRPLVLFP